MASHLRSLADGVEKIVIVEGFLVFSQDWLRNLMKVGIHIHIPEDLCKNRRHRVKRVPPGYFDNLIWPAYLQWGTAPNEEKILQLDGTRRKEEVLEQARIFLSKNSIW